MNDKLKTEKTKIELSLGHRRIRVRFNPDARSLVDEIKRKTSYLIDLLQNEREQIKDETDFNFGERLRLISLAQTAYEEAAMWAVKADTL